MVDRRLGRSLIGIWFADRRLVHFVIGIWVVLSLSRSLRLVRCVLSFYGSLSLLRV